ncbi:hypothetical protein AQUCO_01400245v1 [Aquilegia coerulea]|uniref:DOG1 domain-containing protein n=1 Tax=Aquilegia coerulea TaxID=218851 RepID=A0A2G5DVD0_AQUCA|nr:hypothetical protein AQUCO_01400245v1 [Aquilegia coerulea]
MSLPPGSAAYMSSTIHHVQAEQESFHNFFQAWIVEQDNHLNELISASKTQAETNSSKEEAEMILRPLINQVVQHYEEYYQAKSNWGKQDVLAMLSPTWTSSFEDAFLWIGGWRPSMAFHLLYSKSGLQLEAKLEEILRGLGTGDLGDLTPSQLVSVDELHRKIIKEEKKITEKMAKHQETVADTSMVDLSHIMTELQNAEAESGLVNSTLAPKEEGLERLLQIADDLRLTTLKGVINILSAIQAVHFLIAAAELHLRIHEWGQKRDAANHTHLNPMASTTKTMGSRHPATNITSTSTIERVILN